MEWKEFNENNLPTYDTDILVVTPGGAHYIVRFFAGETPQIYTGIMTYDIYAAAEFFSHFIDITEINYPTK